jgi:hypothetical protein
MLFRTPTCGAKPHILTNILNCCSVPLSPTTESAMMRITDFRSRFLALALLVFAICAFLYYEAPLSHLSFTAQTGQWEGHTSGAVLTGHAIAPKLGNATAKYVHRNKHAQLSCFGHGGKKSSTDGSGQGRTGSRGVESSPHNLCSLS